MVDNAQLGQREALFDRIENVCQELRLIGQNVTIFLQDSR